MKKFMFCAAVAVLLTAHVGSPNAVFEGSAGPYPVQVIVRPPEVVPGLAEVIVRIGASDVQRVVIRPVFWRAGEKGAPQGDPAKLVAGQKNLYSGNLWLMSRGAYSVYVTVNGARGSGMAIVPVAALATGRLPLSTGLGAILIVLGALLLAGLVTIVRAAAGESMLEAGQTLDAAMKRRANRIALIISPVFVLLLFGGAKWWNAVDADYRRTMYAPPAVDPSVHGDTLRLHVHDTAAFHAIVAPVIPDHGKMMHLFLITPGAHDNFGHFHPIETDSLNFSIVLSQWPKGRYKLFGDIVLANGLSQTVSTTIDWPGGSFDEKSNFDDDDSWWPLCANQIANVHRAAVLCYGQTMSWAGDTSAIRAGRPVDLRFDVRGDKGQIATDLLPYLGMAAHAVILSADESVFVHLHPMGTVSSSAQQTFTARDRGDTSVSGQPRLPTDSMAMPVNIDGHLTFPYQFPKPGRYRIWVQVRPPYAQVVTGVFDLDVH